MRQASDPLSVLELSFADEEDKEATIRGGIQPISQDEKEYRSNAMKRRLNRRCKGLLESPALRPKVQNHSSHRDELEPARGFQSQKQSLYPPDEPVNLNVEYLHRTVKDFLENPEICNILLGATQPPFDPNVSLSRAFLLRLKDHRQDGSPEKTTFGAP